MAGGGSKPVDTLYRLLRKVTVGHEGGCWMWQAGSNKGYGLIAHEGRMQRAHRVAYTLIVGPIPDGMDLDHLCRRTLCVYPGHLEPVSRAENLRRARAARAASDGSGIVSETRGGQT